MTDATAWTPRTTPLVPPVYHAVTYGLDDKSYDDITAGGLNETWYGRFSNPTVSAAAEPIRRLEGTPAGLLTASGMAAIATTLVTLLRAGDRVVAARAVYGDTRDLLTRDLPAFGVTVDLVDGHDLDQWRDALAAGPVALAYGETLANPTLRLLDIADGGRAGARGRRPAGGGQHVRHPVRGPAVRCSAPTWWSSRPPSSCPGTPT